MFDRSCLVQFTGSTATNCSFFQWTPSCRGNYNAILDIGFLLVAIVAGALGFFGIAGMAAAIAKVLFFIFVILFIVSLVAGRRIV
jgi:uncharacterized membrane protein YtjA (UPF0391 family)